MPPYGGSITTNVYYASSTLCDPNVDTSLFKPDQNPRPSPFILMVDRGDCTFVQKVRQFAVKKQNQMYLWNSELTLFAFLKNIFKRSVMHNDLEPLE
jgi:hypothetical protein